MRTSSHGRRAARLAPLACAVAALTGCQSDSPSNDGLDNWPPPGSYTDAAYPVLLADGATVPGYLNDAGVLVPLPGWDGALLPFDGSVLLPDGAVLAGDGASPGDAGAQPDAGEPDTGVPEDAGELDAGGNQGMDAGKPDAGAPDAGKPDAGAPDAGKPDAGVPDAGAPDAGKPDAGAASISSCTVTATTAAQPNSREPGHSMYGCAIWIQNTSNTLRRRLARYYTRSTFTNLPTYTAAASGVSPLDGVTGASIVGDKLHTLSWDVKDVGGAVIPDGQYRVAIETHGVQADTTLYLNFTKTGSAVVNVSSSGQGVTSANITCR